MFSKSKRQLLEASVVVVATTVFSPLAEMLTRLMVTPASSAAWMPSAVLSLWSQTLRPVMVTVSKVFVIVAA